MKIASKFQEQSSKGQWEFPLYKIKSLKLRFYFTGGKKSMSFLRRNLNFQITVLIFLPCCFCFLEGMEELKFFAKSINENGFK